MLFCITQGTNAKEIQGQDLTIIGKSTGFDSSQVDILALKSSIDSLKWIITNKNSNFDNVIPYLPIWTTILAAIFGFIIALKTAKVNVISNSRIKWIQDLRILISEFVANVDDFDERLRHLYRLKKANKLNQSDPVNINEAMNNALFEYGNRIKVSKHKIRLFLNNTSEDKHNLLVTLSEDLIRSLHQRHYRHLSVKRNNKPTNDIKKSISIKNSKKNLKLPAIRKLFLDESRNLLKAEWEKAKCESRIMPVFLWEFFNKRKISNRNDNNVSSKSGQDYNASDGKGKINS